LRNIPIFTFINKMDREARDPFALCEEIEKELGIETVPVNWPLGCGKEFQGVYDRDSREILRFTSGGNAKRATATTLLLDDPELDTLLPPRLCSQLREDRELLDGAGVDFDRERVLAGKLSPVFFGSALTNFGVEPFLERFLELTTPPLPRNSDRGLIDPLDDDFSAFVFKIQANMNKAHRDRIAFMRVCSGRFDKEREVYHVQGGKKLRLSQPQQLMAAEREIIDEAFAGDIIGVFDPGAFAIGDTLCMPGSSFRFDPIPTFAPEHFARVRPVDTMKRKQFVKGAEQIALEGAIQIFRLPYAGMEEVVVGVVGTLQFDVLEYRLRSEYNVEIHRESLPYQYLRWIAEPEGIPEDELILSNDAKLVEDYRGNKLILFSSAWSIKWVTDHNKNLVLSEFGKE
jgi:peptide chain release factor 3